MPLLQYYDPSQWLAILISVLKGCISCIFLQSATLVIYSLIYVLRYLEKCRNNSLVVKMLKFFFTFMFLFSDFLLESTFLYE